GDRGVDEPAGVDDHEVCAAVIGRDRIALGPQLGEDLLGIDEGLRAAERHEAYARRVDGSGFGGGWQGINAMQLMRRKKRHAAALCADQRFLSSSAGACPGAVKFGNGNAVNMPRVWSCMRCCMSMKSFALCSR